MPGQGIVKFKGNASASSISALAARHGLKEEDQIEGLEMRLMAVPEGSEREVISKLAANRLVEYAEPNYLQRHFFAPNDTYYVSKQWNLQIIGMPAAWDISRGSSSVKVAVIDTGIDTSHPDRPVNLLSGYNYVSNNEDVSDSFGQGTFVSGIVAAATNNSVGVAGVAPGVTVVMYKEVNPTTGSFPIYATSKAIQTAADNGAKVINLSFGGPDYSDTQQSAIDYAWGKGALIVTSAGNCGPSSPSSSCTQANQIQYPAACRNVLGVGSTTSTDTVAGSSTQNSSVDVSAPGQSITSLRAGGGYKSGSGTSFAAPHVAALAALIWSVNPNLTNKRAGDIIVSTAKDLGTAGRDNGYGFGRIDAYAALVKASGGSITPTVTPTPTRTPTPTPTVGMPAGYTISGTVYESLSGVLRGATVTLSPLGWQSTTSVADGGFRFTNVPNGAYSLTVSPRCTPFGCYEPKSVTVANADVQVAIYPIPLTPTITATSTPTLTPTAGTGDNAAAMTGPFNFTLDPGQKVEYIIKFKDTGSSIWRSSDGYYLKSIESGTTAGLGNPVSSGGCDGLLPGSSCSWNRTLTAGSTPSTNERHYRMYHGSAGFGDTISLTWTVRGATPTPTPTLTPDSGGPPPPPVGGTQVTYSAGWNIVAGPGGATFPGAGSMLYTVQEGLAYTVQPNAQGVTEGWGYWANFASDTTVVISGAGSSSYTTTLSPGQTKMVGNPSGTKIATVSAEKIYVYDPKMGYSVYFGTATLKVGQGAWAYSPSGGTVTVTAQ